MAATSAQPANIGFDFSNYARNEFLGAKLGGQPRGELTLTNAETDNISYLDWYHHRRTQVWRR